MSLSFGLALLSVPGSENLASQGIVDSFDVSRVFGFLLFDAALVISFTQQPPFSSASVSSLEYGRLWDLARSCRRRRADSAASHAIPGWGRFCYLLNVLLHGQNIVFVIFPGHRAPNDVGSLPTPP